MQEHNSGTGNNQWMVRLTGFPRVPSFNAFVVAGCEVIVRLTGCYAPFFL